MSIRSFHLLLPLVLQQGMVFSGHAQPEVLTRVEQIRSLSRDDAVKGLPVRLRGVVIWQNSSPRPAFLVYDGASSIRVDRPMAMARGVWRGGEVPAGDCEVGALIEIDGITDPGGYAPCVLPESFRRVGSGPLPEARRVPLERLLSGREDGQLVEVEGVIQTLSPPDEFGDSKVMVMVDGHSCLGC